MAKTDFQTVDDYIATFPESTRQVLEAVRRAIREGIPDAQEVISYQVPAYRLNGLPIYFAGFQKHFSLYCPGADAMHEAFKDDLARYKKSKSAINFPLDEPVPVDLIRNIARHRAAEYRDLQPARRASTARRNGSS